MVVPQRCRKRGSAFQNCGSNEMGGGGRRCGNGLLPIPRDEVGLNGVEPLTSSLSATRSNQLSYKPIYRCHKDGAAGREKPILRLCGIVSSRNWASRPHRHREATSQPQTLMAHSSCSQKI